MRRNWTKTVCKPCLRSWAAFFIGFNFLFGFAWADAPIPETAQENPDTSPGFVDSLHQSVSATVVQVSDGLDNFFSADRVQKESAGSRVHAYLLTETSQDLRFRAQPTASIRLRLPKTEDKLRLFIESGFRNQEDTDALSPLEQAALNQDDGNWLSAAIQYLIYTSQNWNIHTKSGIAIESLVPDAFATVYARYQFPIGQFNFRFSQELYSYAIAGTGEETRFEIDRRLTDNLLLRSASVGTWTWGQDRLELTQHLILLQKLTPRIAFAYSLGAIGYRDTELHLEMYTADVRFRTQLWRRWFFAELKPVVEFPTATQYQAEPKFLFNLEVVFGG
jgi:hypothetical protein